MENVYQNVKEWFGGDFELYAYFNDTYSKNTIGTFKVPASTAARFNNFATQADINKCIGAVGNTLISIIQAMPKARILKTAKFGFLESDTRFHLKELICDMLQHSVQNRQIWERVNGTNITTNNFTVNEETTNWLLRNDVLGQFAKAAVDNSGINDYEWVDEDAVFMDTDKGNIKVIGKVNTDDIKELKYV